MAKRAKEQLIVREVDPNAWMVTFSDLLTLMLTFFVLLLTMSSMDAKKLRESFGQMTPQPSVLQDTGSSDVLRPSIVPIVQESAFLGSGDSDITTENEAYEELQRLLEALEDGREDVVIEQTDEGIVVRFGSDLLFRPNSDELTADAARLLDSLSPLLARLRFDMRIVGHASSPGGEGANPPAEMSLSLRRAHTVLTELTRNVTVPVPEGKFTLVGRGAQMPARDPEFEDETALLPVADPRNRRVEIIILTRIKAFSV